MSLELTKDALAFAPTSLLIGGRWVPAESGRQVEVVNPATEEVLTAVAAGGPADGLKALDAAAAAAKQWAATPSRVRGETLRRAFDLIMAHMTELATLITLEMGKPLADAKGEVRYGAEFFRWYAEEAVRTYGRTAESPEGNLDII
ncbi:MAG: aldehyde dehydrogenase family protein, partial [Bifidobacteriaceae bacterium]|nr:aldehyde dehydrogenase family protein [Bifidobacteriaceae bacterium]